ncbi:MAG: hypothetical protein Kow0056_11580 [Coriobacteriia bacterium]
MTAGKDQPDRKRLLDELDSLIYRMGRVAASQGAALTAAFDITPPQYMVMGALNERGLVRVSDVASHLGVSVAAASMLIQSLVERGFVERSDDPDDRRVTLVGLTGEGARLFRTVEGLRRGFMERITGALSTQELEAMLRTMHRLLDAAIAEAATSEEGPGRP